MHLKGQRSLENEGIFRSKRGVKPGGRAVGETAGMFLYSQVAEFFYWQLRLSIV